MPDNWTYIVEEPRRSELLREWGVPETIISLGSGSVPDEVTDRMVEAQVDFQLRSCQTRHRMRRSQRADRLGAGVLGRGDVEL